MILQPKGRHVQAKKEQFVTLSKAKTKARYYVINLSPFFFFFSDGDGAATDSVVLN